MGGKLSWAGTRPGFLPLASSKDPSVWLPHINWGSFFYMARTGKPGTLMPPWPWCMPQEMLAGVGDVVDVVSSPYNLLMLS